MSELTRAQQADYDRWSRLNLTACRVCWERHAQTCPRCNIRICATHEHDCKRKSYDLKIILVSFHKDFIGINWRGSRDGEPLGYGHTQLYYEGDKLVINNEYMSREFTEALFLALAKQATLLEFDPLKFAT